METAITSSESPTPALCDLLCALCEPPAPACAHENVLCIETYPPIYECQDCKAVVDEATYQRQEAPTSPPCEPPAPLRTFKSARAARMAYTKAEKAYNAARNAEIDIRHADNAARDAMFQPTADETARLAAMRAEYEAIEAPARYQSAAFTGHCDLMNEISDRPLRAAGAKTKAAWEAMKAIYEAAQKQGMWIRSYHLNYNPTRDLIAANID